MAKIISSIGNSSVTKTSQLINDGENSTSEYVEFIELGDVAISNNYNDLDNIPTTFTPSSHTHIVTDISGNKSQFNNSLTDGDFLFVGDVSETPDATTIVKGKIKLAGDLGGTADLPTINVKTLNSTSIKGSGDIIIDKTFVGLGNADNTSDLNKPISTATQTQLNNRALVSQLNTDSITNNSLVTGGTTTDALNTLKASIPESYTKIQFTADGVQDTFSIGVAATIKAVFWNGALLNDADWSQTGTTFTLTFIPTAGDLIKPI